MDPILILIQIAVLLMSVVIHEVSHGLMANYLGDPTAKYAGRLTLNPIKHITLFGFLILPILTFLAWGFPIGSAKPVPVNFHNIRDKKWGIVMVSAAGVISNLIIAIIFGLSIRFISGTGITYVQNLLPIFKYVVFLNLLLTVFNLVPIPPLDGSRIVFEFFPSGLQSRLKSSGQKFKLLISKYWTILMILAFFLLPSILATVFDIILKIVKPLFVIITGQPFSV
jgi:Zn-dependent protease